MVYSALKKTIEQIVLIDEIQIEFLKINQSNFLNKNHNFKNNWLFERTITKYFYAANFYQKFHVNIENW
jgi:histidinol-phosphate/aromatic aminotransferase/cobyric acid decarboxylase-like protein